jgi:hypothetical protein
MLPFRLFTMISFTTPLVAFFALSPPSPTTIKSLIGLEGRKPVSTSPAKILAYPTAFSAIAELEGRAYIDIAKTLGRPDPTLGWPVVRLRSGLEILSEYSERAGRLLYS